jgi:malate dehydrogenase (oxaloacetate-decarboxylating)
MAVEGPRVIFRLSLERGGVSMGQVMNVIAEHGGEVAALDTPGASEGRILRDVTVSLAEASALGPLRVDLEGLAGVRVVAVSDHVFLAHLGGKIGIALRREVRNREDLSTVYTPGVAKVCEAIAANPDLAYNLTMKRNSVAIVTDGSAVLGLGRLGPKGALPVMEGKAMLFKRFADIDAFPVCLDVHSAREIVDVTAAIAPQFGGINLEDIAAPLCFEVEEELRRRLDIPVFHDDQHGTAIVVLAALKNALRVVGKALPQVRIVIAGAGAAGVAVARLLAEAGAADLVVTDRSGVIGPGRSSLDGAKAWLRQHTNRAGVRGTLADALRGADVFIGVSGPALVGREELRSMAPDPIVFALANPVPEVMPEQAEGIARVMATGRSDYPNQVNNALAFPGVFRGALDSRALAITPAMELAAADALAGVVGADELSEAYIIPSVFNPQVVERVARAVQQAAAAGMVARGGGVDSAEDAAHRSWAATGR